MSSQLTRSRYISLLCCMLLLWLAGCAGRGPLRGNLPERVARPSPGVVLFLCDGVNADLLEQGCREGWLPNIDLHFCQRGAHVQNAITIHPSITYAAVTTLLTGCYPQQHRIPGNRWFDPQQRLLRNYVSIRAYRCVNDDVHAETIYERIAPAYSVSVQSPLTRGVSRNVANWAQSGVRWFFEDYVGVDGLTAKTVELVARESTRAGQWPTLLTLYFPGLDTVGHLHGASSPEYRAAMINLDLHVGRVCDWLERQGMLQSTYIVLVSDHGMVDVDPDRCVELVQASHYSGCEPTHPACQHYPYEWRRRHFNRCDQVVAYEDGRCAYVYFAGPTGWDERPSPAAVEERLTSVPPEWQLWNLDGVDLVGYLAAQDEAIIRSPLGQARIVARTEGEIVEYQYLPSPDDVLGYLETPELASFVAAGFHDSQQWLEATCREDIPALVPDLVPLLREPRMGQAVVFAAAGCNFLPDQHGGHGGLRRSEMRVPFMVAGPGIAPGGVVECTRAVDLVPTIMELLDLEPPTDLPGDPIAFPRR